MSSSINVKQPVLLHTLLFSSVSHWSRLESLPSQSLSGLGTPLGERMTNLGIQQSFFDYTSIRNYRGHCQARTSPRGNQCLNLIPKVFLSAWLPLSFPALGPLTRWAKHKIFWFSSIVSNTIIMCVKVCRSVWIYSCDLDTDSNYILNPHSYHVLSLAPPSAFSWIDAKCICILFECSQRHHIISRTSITYPIWTWC